MKTYDLLKYCNTFLAEYLKGTKPTWALSEREKRILRYAEAYQKNSALIHFINSMPGSVAVTREL